MACEVLNNKGERIEWHTSFAQIDGEVRKTLEIGDTHFDRTELNIAILRFMGGLKQFSVRDTEFIIPDTIQGNVRVGDMEFPYEQFVDGVHWVLTQGGSFAQEQQVPRWFAVGEALILLRKKLKLELPIYSDHLVSSANDFEKQHNEPEGIYGMADTMRAPKIT
ncbi:MAG: hypothetical protein Q7R44_00360 [bacterium]|nr:hypothetical protein [bacterium]